MQTTIRSLSIVAALAAAIFAADTSRRAPGFSLTDAKGQEHDLADYRGKVIVLDFMQTACPHCNAFASVLSQIEQKYGDRVAILSIVNPPDTPNTVVSFAMAHKISYPILFDCGQVAYSYLRSPAFDIPHLYLIDPNGAIREDFGYGDATKTIFEGNGLFPHLDALLKK
ncbi:MAG: TlpA family protein disulfide reductase [Acidobacteriia bacterium]|nr:TlpA family protein disulfide reductase [Terriglobia bacterium]MBV8905605.1 TlpA family protein disulfide reductase [Terriglobia bacterium]